MSRRHISALTFISATMLGLSAYAATPAAAPATAPAATATKTMTLESGKVEFLAVGKPSFLKVKGEGATPVGTLTVANGKATGEFSIDLAKLSTGIEMRDEHMKEKYLEVAKHPKAIVRFKDIDVKDGAAKGAIPAELELHGQKKPITMDAELKDGKATGKFKIKLSDYAIEIPKYSGITIADDVDVTIESVLK